MSREIRKVPSGWEHPKDSEGIYIPMFDETYDDAAQKWLQRLMAWESGNDPDRNRRNSGCIRYFWDWDGGPPDQDSFRPTFKSEPTHLQIYETVSEGTPISPIFPDKDTMILWLIDEGHSRKAAEAFAKGGYAPTMTFFKGRVKMGIDSLDMEGT